MPADDRKKRESDFHDKRFSAEIEPRRSLDTVYRLMLPVNIRYHSVLEGYARAGRVLEYGCGKGDNALVFARRGVSITGIDISRSGVEHARAMAAQAGLEAEFQVMDGENLNFPADTFEVVAGKGILHHLDLDRAMREITRVLKPGGQAIFIEPLGHNPLINWYRRRTPGARTPDERPLREADLEKVRAFFPGAQFTFYNLTTLGALVFRPGTAFSLAFSLLQRLDAWLFRQFPRTGRYSWMVFMDLRRPVKRA